MILLGEFAFYWVHRWAHQPLKHPLLYGMHHTHHGYGKDGKAYRSFCTMITLYDRLFKTLHIPEGRSARYGIMGREKHWLEEIVFPLYHRKPASAPAVDGTVGN